MHHNSWHSNSAQSSYKAQEEYSGTSRPVIQIAMLLGDALSDLSLMVTVNYAEMRADLQVLDSVCHASLAKSRPDSCIPLTGIEGVQVVPHSPRENHRILQSHSH